MDTSRSSRYRTIAGRTIAVVAAGIVMMGMITPAAQAQTPDSSPTASPAAPAVDTAIPQTAPPASKPVAPAPKSAAADPPPATRLTRVVPNRPRTASQTATTVTATATRVIYGDATTLTVTVHGTAPAITGTVTASYVGFVVAQAGVSNGTAVIALPRDWNSGTRRVTFNYGGDSTHGAASAAINITRDKAMPKVVSSTPQTTYGKPAKVSVAVQGHGGGASASGLVRAYQGTQLLATGTLVKGRATLTLPGSGGAGTHVVVVRYPGDKNYDAATGSNRVVITKVTPTLNVDPVGSVISSDRAHVSLSVAPVWAYPTGTITVTSSGFPTVSSGLALAGATVFLAPRKAGTYSVTVRYPGDGNYNAVTKTVSFRIAPATGTVTSFVGTGVSRVGGAGGVQPGLYRSHVGAGGTCYWARTTDKSGRSSSVLGEGGSKVSALVQINPTDKFIFTHGCGTFTLVSQSANQPYLNKSFPGSGTFVVGRDIAPGHYREITAGCFFGFKRAQNGVDTDYITAWKSNGVTDIYISGRSYTFETAGCSTWKRIS